VEAFMNRTIILGLATLAALTQAWAGDAAKPAEPAGLDSKEASIPFASQREAIRTWQADGDQGLWIQDSRKQWYYAKTFAPCFGLPFAIQIGFRNRAMNRLNRDSEIIVPNESRCPLSSLKKSGPPPGKEGKQDAAAEKPAS
jgi:hypothetical protein